jgi:hypothetical protein
MKLIWLIDALETLLSRWWQLRKRRAKEIDRRRKQFGMYFGWYNTNSQLVILERREKV